MWKFVAILWKIKITGRTPAGGNENDVEIMVPVKYLSNFWRTLEIPLINCKVSLMLTWSSTYVITNSIGEGKFEIRLLLYQILVFTIMEKHKKLI